jgi:hypothetical protein
MGAWLSIEDVVQRWCAVTTSVGAHDSADARAGDVQQVLDDLAAHEIGALQGIEGTGWSEDVDLDDALQVTLANLSLPLVGTSTGVPPLRWDAASAACATVADDGALVLSSMPRLRDANGLQLKPIRRWICQHFAWRPQLAPGVWLVAGLTGAVLFSTRGLTLSGFLHHGHERRFSVNLPPCGYQIFEL